MEFHFSGDGDGINVRLKVKWLSLVALVKALVATAIAAPEVVRLLEQLGK